MIWDTVKRNTNYEVSSTGLVRSKDRVTTNKLGVKKKYKSKELAHLKGGYKGNQHNNHVDNLEWVTRSENAQHMWDLKKASNA